MPIVPIAYPGLKTSLADMWIDKEDESNVTEDESEDLDDQTEMILIIVGASVGGLIFFCCVGYLMITCCANRINKVTYIEKGKKAPKPIATKKVELA